MCYNSTNMKKYKITAIVVVIIILLGCVGYFSYKKIKENKQTTQQPIQQTAQAGPQWINVDKKSLPLDFPNIPMLSQDTVSVNHYFVEQKNISKKTIQMVFGDYNYTVENSNIPKGLTAQTFYADSLKLPSKDGNNWKVSQVKTSISATQGGTSVQIDFSPSGQSETIINIIYTYTHDVK